jgi:hypothetical protein
LLSCYTSVLLHLTSRYMLKELMKLMVSDLCLSVLGFIKNLFKILELLYLLHALHFYLTNADNIQPLYYFFIYLIRNLLFWPHSRVMHNVPKSPVFCILYTCYKWSSRKYHNTPYSSHVRRILIALINNTHLNTVNTRVHIIICFGELLMNFI